MPLLWQQWTTVTGAAEASLRQCGACTRIFLPVQPYTLSTLEERLKGMYRSVTDGKFSEALRQVNALLAIIPLTVVATRHEVDELKELISIARSALSSSLAHLWPVHMHLTSRRQMSVPQCKHLKK